MIDRPHRDDDTSLDPDEHPAHVEEWRADEATPVDVDHEAVIDEAAPTALRTDRGDTIVVPDEDRAVPIADDDLDDSDEPDV